jgi:hypothetical protein
MAVFGHTANNSFQDGFKKRSRPTECGMIFTNFELSSSEHVAEDIFRLARIFGFLMLSFDAGHLLSSFLPRS